MICKLKEVIDYSNEEVLVQGYPHFGFHDIEGNKYILNYDNHWIAKIENDDVVFTIGKINPFHDVEHFSIEIENPKFLDGSERSKILFNGNKKVYRFDMKTKKLQLIIDGDDYNFDEIGNCVYDKYKHIWINEIRACKIYHFDYDGKLIEVLGDGTGFNKDTVSFTDVRFNWMYDLRKDNEGHILVLDSKNYALRKIDVDKKMVSTIAGTGQSGYSGDGDQAKHCQFGGDETAFFDGPWSMSVDEMGHIYIGDTQNHVIRVIDPETGLIHTLKIRENDEVKNIQIPLICSMDYHEGILYVPDYEGPLFLIDVKRS